MPFRGTAEGSADTPDWVVAASQPMSDTIDVGVKKRLLGLSRGNHSPGQFLRTWIEQAMASDISTNPADRSAEPEKRGGRPTPPVRRTDETLPKPPQQRPLSPRAAAASPPFEKSGAHQGRATPVPLLPVASEEADRSAEAARGGSPPAAPGVPPLFPPDGSADIGTAASGSSQPATSVPAFAMSMLLHVVVLLALALIVSEPPQLEPPRLIISPPSEQIDEFVEEFEAAPTDSPDVDIPDIEESILVPDTVTEMTEVNVESLADDFDAAPLDIELTDFSLDAAPSSDFLQHIGAIGGEAGGLGGRRAGERERLVEAGGGSKQSEQAVELGLKWILAHQLPDGGWTFDLTKCPSCRGQCSHSGTDGQADRSAATAMALLPFFGRGYTHREGPYQLQVEAGLNYLATVTVQGKGKAYPQGGTLYTQGLVGIVLSEAYAMTQDPRLAGPAQLALNFIMESQDPVGGGWRYSPRQSPGDTSVVGWQLMALKSGYMANLQVSPLTVKKAEVFLDSVQSEDGATYGYTDPGNGPGTSAVGLLCRMYLGWKKDHPSLQRGVEILGNRGPTANLYYNYYATQVMHHFEGDAWVQWNAKMRDRLIDSQATAGHEAGSWYEGFDTGHGPEVAGRLYITSLATMILEVYYRHLPIYGQASVTTEFEE